MFDDILKNKGLSLERLHLFCEVVRAGGIKLAIGDDPTRQSLASRQLKELSEYVGAKLYVKNGRSLEITEAGHALSRIGNHFFQELEAFLQTTRGLPGKFSLGVGDSIFQWHILPKMKQFENQFPTIHLMSYSYTTSEIIQKVVNHTLDAGLVRRDALPQTNLTCETIGEIKYQLFIPVNFIQDANKPGRTPPINNIPFCTLTGDGEYTKALTLFLSAFNGFSTLNCSSMTQMFTAVQSGLYAAVLPENAKIGLPPTIAKAYTLPELTPFTREIALIYQKESVTHKADNDIIDFLRHAIN